MARRIIEIPESPRPHARGSAVRTGPFDAARGDRLVCLHADEVLVAEDGIARNHDALRGFRKRPAPRFEGRIHETVAHRVPGHQARARIGRRVRRRKALAIGFGPAALAAEADAPAAA